MSKELDVIIRGAVVSYLGTEVEGLADSIRAAIRESMEDASLTLRARHYMRANDGKRWDKRHADKIRELYAPRHTWIDESFSLYTTLGAPREANFPRLVLVEGIKNRTISAAYFEEQNEYQLRAEERNAARRALLDSAKIYDIATHAIAMQRAAVVLNTALDSLGDVSHSVREAALRYAGPAMREFPDPRHW